MRAASDSYVVDVLLAIHSQWRRVRAVARRVRRLTASAFDPYRPELHYMRGPGPKWREIKRPLRLWRLRHLWPLVSSAEERVQAPRDFDDHTVAQSSGGATGVVRPTYPRNPQTEIASLTPAAFGGHPIGPKLDQHRSPNLKDRKSQITSALGQGLKLLRTIDALSKVELKSMRDEGLIDEATYRQMAGRTAASDFMSLISFVKERVSDATNDEIVEMLVAMEVVEIIEGGTERNTIAKLLKGRFAACPPIPTTRAISRGSTMPAMLSMSKRSDPEIDRIAKTPYPLAEREQQIAEIGG